MGGGRGAIASGTGESESACTEARSPFIVFAIHYKKTESAAVDRASMNAACKERDKGERWSRTLLGSDHGRMPGKCATVTRITQPRSYALLPGDATEKVAMRWMEDKDKRAGAFRLFWVALAIAKIWRAGFLPIGQVASASASQPSCSRSCGFRSVHEIIRGGLMDSSASEP